MATGSSSAYRKSNEAGLLGLKIQTNNLRAARSNKRVSGPIPASHQNRLDSNLLQRLQIGLLDPTVGDDSMHRRCTSDQRQTSLAELGRATAYHGPFREFPHSAYPLGGR